MGDLNGDGKLDVVTANATDNTLSAYQINTTIPNTCTLPCTEPVGQLNQVAADATGPLTIATGTDPVSLQVVFFTSTEPISRRSCI